MDIVKKGALAIVVFVLGVLVGMYHVEERDKTLLAAAEQERAVMEQELTTWRRETGLSEQSRQTASKEAGDALHRLFEDCDKQIADAFAEARGQGSAAAVPEPERQEARMQAIEEKVRTMLEGMENQTQEQLAVMKAKERPLPQ